MDWGTKRKFSIIAVIFLIILSISSYFVYVLFIKKTPTCTDGLRNQDERGIDCGGVCTRMCTADAVPVITTWQRAVEISDGVYSAAAYIDNQNKYAGIRKLKYEMKMYNKKNILITEPIIGETYIGPNQKTVIVENNIIVGNEKPETVFFKWLPPIVWDRTPEGFEKSYIRSDKERITDRDTYPKISAELINTHPTYDYINLPVVILVYDASGNLITLSNTLVDILPHQGKTEISFSWQKPFSESVGTIEIIPRINPF